jgi:hypothetical protein
MGHQETGKHSKDATMRRFLYPVLLMLVGVLVSTLLAFALASVWRSFNKLWLMPLVLLPAGGVAAGCWLAHRLSGGLDPWPITNWAGRILLVLVGSLGSAAASYLVYIAISAVWFNLDFFEMVFSPSSIRSFSGSNRFGQHEQSLATNLIVGLLVGSFATFRFIREAWD